MAANCAADAHVRPAQGDRSAVGRSRMPMGRQTSSDGVVMGRVIVSDHAVARVAIWLFVVWSRVSSPCGRRTPRKA